MVRCNFTNFVVYPCKFWYTPAQNFTGIFVCRTAEMLSGGPRKKMGLRLVTVDLRIAASSYFLLGLAIFIKLEETE